VSGSIREPLRRHGAEVEANSFDRNPVAHECLLKRRLPEPWPGAGLVVMMNGFIPFPSYGECITQIAVSLSVIGFKSEGPLKMSNGLIQFPWVTNA